MSVAPIYMTMKSGHKEAVAVKAEPVEEPQSCAIGGCGSGRVCPGDSDRSWHDREHATNHRTALSLGQLWDWCCDQHFTYSRHLPHRQPLAFPVGEEFEVFVC